MGVPGGSILFLGYKGGTPILGNAHMVLVSVSVSSSRGIVVCLRVLSVLLRSASNKILASPPMPAFSCELGYASCPCHEQQPGFSCISSSNARYQTSPPSCNGFPPVQFCKLWVPPFLGTLSCAGSALYAGPPKRPSCGELPTPPSIPLDCVGMLPRMTLNPEPLNSEPLKS